MFSAHVVAQARTRAHVHNTHIYTHTHTHTHKLLHTFGNAWCAIVLNGSQTFLHTHTLTHTHTHTHTITHTYLFEDAWCAVMRNGSQTAIEGSRGKPDRQEHSQHWTAPVCVCVCVYVCVCAGVYESTRACVSRLQYACACVCHLVMHV